LEKLFSKGVGTEGIAKEMNACGDFGRGVLLVFGKKIDCKLEMILIGLREVWRGCMIGNRKDEVSFGRPNLENISRKKERPA
jgi:hypothetical protein